MRNLRTVAYCETSLVSNLPLTAAAWDTANETSIVALGPSPTQPLVELKRRAAHVPDDHGDGLVAITSWDAPCPLPDLTCDQIVSLRYFADSATSCLVLAGGDVVVVREKPSPGEEKIEIVGTVDAGIHAATWSPDAELLAVVSRAGALLLMSRGFDLLNETTFSPADLHVSKQVSVGWGKKETQFRGRGANALRDPTVPEFVDSGKPSPHDRGDVGLSWRGDGQYIAVNSIEPDHRRIIRVFDREAELDSASEAVDGLESGLSWKPSGNLIAGVKRSPDKVEVVFFERNGLRHGQFDLRVGADEMESWASTIELHWNPDSTILAVVFADRVQFWTMGNYHYYLKQELRLRSSPGRILLHWHPENPLRVCLGGFDYLLDLAFARVVSRGSTVPPHDHGIVGVIDGKTLKLTPFGQAAIPPPMSFTEVLLDHNIVDLAFHPSGETFAVLSTDTLELCTWTTRVTGKGSVKFTAKTTARSISLPTSPGAQYRTRYTQTILTDGVVYILAPAQAGQKAICHRVVWCDDDTALHFEPVSLSSNANNLLQDIHGDAVFYTDPLKRGTLPLLQQLPGTAPVELAGSDVEASIFTIDPAEVRIDDNPLARYRKIWLASEGRLYVDDTLLVRDCTSYLLTATHLIFTTSQHFLKLVNLAKLSENHIPGDAPDTEGRCRNIERGAMLVTVMPSLYAVVLQMPRGNLETVYPRSLVLASVRNALQRKDYLAAFRACQTHQLDLNIIYDYDPQTFIPNVLTFLEQVKNPASIDEFLSKIRNEDVTQTLYRKASDPAPPAQAASSTQLIHKVNTIADAFLSAMASKPSVYLQSIITAHVSKSPPDLDSALMLVSSLRQTSPEEADLAVSHLCFLTDANRLFDAALALYDLELTLLVAQNAQRDPREYMPFLQGLQDTPMLRRHFKIDNHLKKFSKALASLQALGAHDEARSYTVSHGLYTTALELYKYDTPNLRQMTRLYAEYLASTSQHAPAAELFELLGDHETAYPLYALAHRWRESLTCATLVPLPPGRISSLAASLASTCADESRDYRAAATIHADYLHDIPGAARTLCKGSYFAEASRILVKHELASEIPLIVDPGLTEKFGEILELVSDCKTQLTAQLTRLQELRTKKAEDPLGYYGGESNMADLGAVDIPDDVSLAATDTSTVGGQSLFTRYGSNASRFGGTVASNVSRKTSKTKRREERKRARGKKGSVYEEEYLIASVGRLIVRINGVHEEVKRLTSALLRRDMRERATKVSEVLREISEQCAEARNQVWQPRQDAGHDESTENQGGHDRPPGAEGVLWDSQQETWRREGVPEVKVWTSL